MKNQVILILFSIVISTLICHAQDPTLWGTTPFGGTNNVGTIFKYKISNGTETKVHDFGSGMDGGLSSGSLIKASNGLLYGMTFEGDLIFSYDISSGKESDVYDFKGGFSDGAGPRGSLIQASDGLLYGMTWEGGAEYGTIFSYNISTGTETKVHDFGNEADGQFPLGSLIQATNGLLYGMTQYGGINNEGIIFSFDISTGKEAILHHFGSGTDGQYPWGSLVQASNGALYGMTTRGGTADYGIIFSYNISTGVETKLHDFLAAEPDGGVPYGSLIQPSDGLLYGLTSLGGKVGGVNGGIIFSYNISTGKETDIHDFGSGNDGQTPFGSLIQASNGLLYGMTGGGSLTSDSGTIFNYDISSGVETVIYEFGHGSDGAFPEGELIEVDSPFTTSINPIANLTDNIHLYPNPSSSNIHLSLKLQQEQLVSLSLYNILGQQVWAEDLGQTKDITSSIPLTNLANGVYILKVTAGGSLQEKEVVVER